MISPTCDGGKFKIRFDNMDKYGHYWVHWTDYDNIAVVGNGRGWVWVLSRNKKYNPEEMKKLVPILKEYGYPSNTVDYARRGLTGAQSKVRFIHNIYEGPNVDVYVGGDKLIESVEYKRITDYFSLKSKHAFIQVKYAGQNRDVIYENLEFKMDQDYTVILTGTMQADPCPEFRLFIIKDENACPLPCTSHLRFIPSDADIRPVDVWIDGEMKFSGMEYPFFGNVDMAECCNKFKNISIKSGAVKFQLKMRGTDDVIFEQNLGFEPQRVYTLMPSGRWTDKEGKDGLVLMHTIGLDYCVNMC